MEQRLLRWRPRFLPQVVACAPQKLINFGCLLRRRCRVSTQLGHVAMMGALVRLVGKQHVCRETDLSPRALRASVSALLVPGYKSHAWCRKLHTRKAMTPRAVAWEEVTRLSNSPPVAPSLATPQISSFF
ncbi:hypothetical protein MRX96_042274 [Rhipicephalus microplus]